MTDFIFYCDKNKFLDVLDEEVAEAPYRDDVSVLIKCADNKYIVFDGCVVKGPKQKVYCVMFENPRPDSSNGSIIWKVWNDDECVNAQVVIDDDDRDSSWSKPSEEECESIAQWFSVRGIRVRIPEYNLDFTGEEEEEEEEKEEEEEEETA